MGRLKESKREYELSRSRLEDLASLPFTTKRELIADQEQNPLFGHNHTYPLSEYIRFHQTSGTTGHPLKILDTQESWDWWADCWTSVYQAAGVGREDIVFLAFGFGPFIGFWSAKEVEAFTTLGSSPSLRREISLSQEGFWERRQSAKRLG